MAPLREGTPAYAKRRRTLRTWNIVAFALQFASFIGALVVAIIFRNTSFRTELTTDLRRADIGPPGGTTVLNSLGAYPIIWLEIAFPIITAMFHGAIAFVPEVNAYYTRSTLIEGRNLLRWTEYSITASIMTWVIMQLSGVTNLFMLVLGGVIANVVLQFHGYYMELLNPPQRRRVNWLPTVIGWLLFCGQWFVIMYYFFFAVGTAASAVPWFVYTIIIGLFFQFATFGFAQLMHYAGWPKFVASEFGIEVFFVSLSIFSKLFLDWFLLIGIATGPY